MAPLLDLCPSLRSYFYAMVARRIIAAEVFFLPLARRGDHVLERHGQGTLGLNLDTER